MSAQKFLLVEFLVVILAGCIADNDEVLYEKIKNNEDYVKLYGESSDVRGTYGFIDEDDIPELFISDGDYHSTPISIFTINSSTGGDIEYLGSFGSNGEIKYLEKSNYMEVEYGNHGCFYNIFMNSRKK